LEAFAEHWGQKSLNALRALHALCYSDGFGSDTDDVDVVKNKKVDKNSFLNFQHDDDDDEFNDLLK